MNEERSVKIDIQIVLDGDFVKDSLKTHELTIWLKELKKLEKQGLI